MSGKERIQWVDACKAYAIFLVVLGHYYHGSFINSYIYSFHMPLFFFLAGLVSTIQVKTFKDFVRGRIRTLIIPYFTFGLIQVILDQFKSGAMGWTKESFLKEGIELITFTRYWFIGVLILVELSYFFLRKYLTNRKLLTVLFLSSIVGFYLNTYVHGTNDFFLYSHLRTLFTAVVFYALPNIFADRILQFPFGQYLNNVMGILFVLGLFLLNFASYLAFKSFYPNIGIADPQNYFFFYLLSMTGIACSLVLSQMIKSNFLFEYIGLSTLAIYILHANQGIIIKIFSIVGLQLSLLKFSNALFAAGVMILIIITSLYLFRLTKNLTLNLFK